MKQGLVRIISHPLGQRIAWILFAIIFYLSGEQFTLWLMSDQSFGGGLAWIAVLAFPFLLPAFFVVNRYLGCASGTCADGVCMVAPEKPEADKIYFYRPPG